MMNYLVKQIKDFGRDNLIPIKIRYQLGNEYAEYLIQVLQAFTLGTITVDRLIAIGFNIPKDFALFAILFIGFGYILFRYFSGCIIDRFKLPSKEERWRTEHLTHYGIKQINWQEENNTTLKGILEELVKQNGKRKANIYK